MVRSSGCASSVSVWGTKPTLRCKGRPNLMGMGATPDGPFLAPRGRGNQPVQRGAGLCSMHSSPLLPGRVNVHDACPRASRSIAAALDRIPFLGVADIVDRHIVMLAPEKRHGAVRRLLANHVERRGLTLALGDDPVLDADALTHIGIGPARNVAGGVDVRRAGLKILVPACRGVDREPGLFGERDT